MQPPAWQPWGGETGDVDQMIVFDVPEDGGVRMVREGLTSESVIASVATDARFASVDERCEVYREMALRAGGQFGEAQYRAIEGGACAARDAEKEG